MKCLHICNDFLGSKVHKNLYYNLDELGLEQTIFYPTRTEHSKKPQQDEPDKNIKLAASKPLKKKHRLFYHAKIKFLYVELLTKIDPADFDIVHATTLFSDGGLAYKIFKDFGVPYIVAVRATDIEAFLKFRPDLAFSAKKILNSASKIIFITDALKKNFYDHWTSRVLKMNFKTKNQVIYNGVDEFWIDNLTVQKSGVPSKVLYVGTFLKRKNVVRLIESVLFLKKRFPEIELTIVGGKGSHENLIKQLSNQNKRTIKYLGTINDKKVLLKEYRSNHIFAMASFNETFGLTYLEALSQGLPVLYSQNDGIDGAFDEKIGEAVNPKSLDSISIGLEQILKNYSTYDLNKIDFTKFSWKAISQTYLNLYKSILKNNLD